MHSLIIFASGTGTNAEAIINYFKGGSFARVALIVSNNSNAGVLKIAAQENIPSLVINKADFTREQFVQQLKSYQPSFVILAGFLWKIPKQVLEAFPNNIINIHPSLLPKYGGKGMYGSHVHEAVLTAAEKESGITIHFVNDVYDEGDKIVQSYCTVGVNDTIDSLAQRIHKLEHFFYPRTIEYLLQNI